MLGLVQNYNYKINNMSFYIELNMSNENPKSNQKRFIISIIWSLVLAFVIIIIGASIFWGW